MLEITALFGTKYNCFCFVLVKLEVESHFKEDRVVNSMLVAKS